MLGLRWRTEQEVVRGKGQFICGARGCEFADNTAMSSYEVLFEYEVRNSSVKASYHYCLCLKMQPYVTIHADNLPYPYNRPYRKRVNTKKRL